jgi:hypothetical protein
MKITKYRNPRVVFPNDVVSYMLMLFIFIIAALRERRYQVFAALVTELFIIAAES